MAKESSTVQRLIPLEIIVGVIAGIITGFTALEYVILVVIMVILFTTETINSAIEEVNDLVTDEISEKVKRSKDLASASVWIWHLMYMGAFVFFLVCHLVNFTWWTQLIPA
jgi:diacylglycerol kinase (ATP)